MSNSHARGTAAFVIALGLSIPAYGGMIDIGGGWTAEWDDSLDPFVSIVSNGVLDDAVFIQKAAQFTQGQEGGFFPAIPIVFRQTADDAVRFIVIDDEIIINSTGEDWSGFTMQLVGNTAMYDPARTLASGGGGPIGFSIAPFTTAVFDDLQLLTIGGGTVANGDVWFPGNGADDGQLWIDAGPGTGGDRTFFVLKETPLPAPGALALIALGLVGGRRRRRD